mmetsp:Transcript_1473/g.4463  ORF Transcript_1473/g.4463 Transcript_1473/m.4463 type:complete len:270 (+) Transcript_1473:171-980(+)
MARSAAKLAVCVWVAVLFGAARGQMIGSRPRPRMSDVKYLTCATCRAAGYRLHQYMQMQQQKLRENDLLTLLESFCDPYQPQGEWIPYYEIEFDRENHRLALKEHEFPGVCNQDCVTISKACSAAIEDSIYEMAEYCITHREDPMEMIQYMMCEGFNKVCHEGMPSPPEDWKGSGFQPQSDEGVQMDNLRRMAGQNVQVLGSDDFPAMMDQIQDMENVDEGTDERTGGVGPEIAEQDDGKPGEEESAGGQAAPESAKAAVGDEIVHDTL